MKDKIFPYMTIATGKKLMRAARVGDLDYIDAQRIGVDPMMVSTSGTEDAIGRAAMTGDPFVLGTAATMLSRSGSKIINCALEFAHSEKGKVIFFEAPTMLDGMAHQCTRVDAIRLKAEWGVLGVAMPTNARIYGHKARPLVFGRTTKRGIGKWIDDMVHYVAAETGYGSGSFSSGPLVDGSRWGEDEPLLIFSAYDNDSQLWSLRTLPWAKFSRILPMTNKEWDKWEDEGLEKTEMWERVHLRFIAGLVVFMDAFPERLVRGLPFSGGMKLLKPQGAQSGRQGRATPYTFKWPVVPETGKPFSFTEDHLVYYQNERYINVRGTYRVRKGHKRGMQFDPYTVTGAGSRN